MVSGNMKEKGSAAPYVLFGLGAAIGAVIGILFAPSEGAETRKKVSEWTKSNAEKGKVALQSSRAQLTAAAQATRKAYEEVFNSKPKEPTHS